MRARWKLYVNALALLYEIYIGSPFGKKVALLCARNTIQLTSLELKKYLLTFRAHDRGKEEKRRTQLRCISPTDLLSMPQTHYSGWLLSGLHFSTPATTIHQRDVTTQVRQQEESITVILPRPPSVRLPVARPSAVSRSSTRVAMRVASRKDFG